MKFFISQPMAGKSHEQIIHEREDLVNKLEKDGNTVIDTVFTDTPPNGNNEALYYLSLSLMKMSECDAAAFLPGWDKARGCRIEHDVAKAYGLKIFYC